METEDARDNLAENTLEASSTDPYEFYGKNDGAWIDKDGVLHGFPPLDALMEGVVICPSPISDGFFHIYVESCWPAFVESLEEELALCDSGCSRPDEGVDVERMRSLVAGPPHRASVDGGSVGVPRDVLAAAGIASDSDVVIVGDSGHFTVWSISVRESLREQLASLWSTLE